MEQSLHWIIEVVWSYSDHIWSGSAAALGGAAYQGSKHAVVYAIAKRNARRAARIAAESNVTEV